MSLGAINNLKRLRERNRVAIIIHLKKKYNNYFISCRCKADLPYTINVKNMHQLEEFIFHLTRCVHTSLYVHFVFFNDQKLLTKLLIYLIFKLAYRKNDHC